MPIDPGGNNTDTSVAAAVAYLESILRGFDLPLTLARLSELLGRMESGEAAHASQQAMVCASSAKRMVNRLGDAFNSIFNNIENVETNISSSSVKFGVSGPFTLGGAPPEDDTVTETGKTWVTANTVVIPFSPAPRTSANEVYGVGYGAIVVGDGFDVTLYNNSATGALADYDVYWIAFPDGVNA